MIIVKEECPRHPEATDLLDRSVAFIRSLYPEEHQHNYCYDQLTQHGKFFVVRHNGVAIGCGAYIWRTRDEAELKHMFVEPMSRGLGCGKILLNHIEQHATHHGVTKMLLETSKKQEQAVGLYEGYGYIRCDPYVTDYHGEDIFMMKMLPCEIASQTKPVAADTKRIRRSRNKTVKE